MAKNFTANEWQKILAALDTSGPPFGLPTRRAGSVVVGTFNIRKLGAVAKRTADSWTFLKRAIEPFDLLAVQEVMDDLSGLEHLVDMLGPDFGMVVSDVAGVKPGSSGNAERLAFIFNWKRVQRTALASDITFDRTEVARNLYENRAEFAKAWRDHKGRIDAWEAKRAERRAAGKSGPAKPPIALPRFVSFIRPPHYASFRIPGVGNAAPYEFLVANAHLLYGEDKRERQWEFEALIDWMTVRAKKADKLYHPNLLLLGDCNLDFDSSVTVMRDAIDARIKKLNSEVLRSKKAAKANFPMLTPHPETGVLRTALRQKQTYDQIGLFIRDGRLPASDANRTAGARVDGFDYGVFNIANLIAHALHGNGDVTQLTAARRKAIYAKAEFSISDHMPAWIRLPRPR